MSFLKSLFGRNPIEENAREAFRQLRENSKKSLPTQNGHFYEYDPDASQEWLYGKRETNDAKSFARKSTTGACEVWSHGRRVASGLGEPAAKRLLGKLMHPSMSDEEIARRWPVRDEQLIKSACDQEGAIAVVPSP